MRFLVDAQIPTRLADFLNSEGHDALHTSHLSTENRMSDREIRIQADNEDRVVVTKDGDFRDTHLIIGSPGRLLLVLTGNISNVRLFEIFRTNLPGILRRWRRPISLRSPQPS
ncbi:MAG: DUF5615 family PIN-like protein [Actinobacteria bacterium]|nr:DUF5615 family PIN-like protein [Actinomycetota bacterium]MCL6105087.1 DUF5615 family PIN-like protein [Actinomycetota bacterium]